MLFEQRQWNELEKMNLLLGTSDHAAPWSKDEVVLCTANLHSFNTLPHVEGLFNPEFLDKHWSIKTSLAQKPHINPYVNFLFGINRPHGFDPNEKFVHNIRQITPIQIREAEMDSLVVLVPPASVLKNEGITVKGVDVYEGKYRTYFPSDPNSKAINVIESLPETSYPGVVIHLNMKNPRREIDEESLLLTITPEFAPAEILKQYNVLSQGAIDPNSEEPQEFVYV